MYKNSLLASVLRVAGGVGFILHILTAVLVIIVRPRWVDAINDSATKFLGEIEEVSSLVSLAEESLTLASTTLNDTSDLLMETSEFIQDSNILLRSVGKIIGEEAPATIQSTQNALEAAQTGSRAVDTMLRGLSVLEPITGFSYDPEKSLSQSLVEIEDGLEPLPETLREIQRQLNQAADELDEVHPGLDLVSKDLIRFSEETEELSTQINMQEERLNLIPDFLENFLHRVAAFGRISTIILCVFLVLGAISYLSVFLFGDQMRSRQEIQDLS
jgi:chromosome segregation ATPase